MKTITYFVLGIVLASVTAFPAQARVEITPEQKVAFAERLIENYYLDEVDGDHLADEAIRAMLKTLDPHSSYSDPKETEELNQPLVGNFSGIGIQFNMLNDTLYVTQTIAGGPSEKVGIIAGDRILTANDTLISGAKRPNSEILKILRGPKGTEVDLAVKRRGVEEPLHFRVTRDDIPIYSIDAAYMAAPGVGFIKVSRFGDKTGREFADALLRLKQQGMKDLIIDLEDNGGGYLGSAVELAENFLNEGDLVTFTDSPKLGKKIFEAEKVDKIVDGRIVVMVNQYSASASEIFSGAMQDHDRGLIVGRRTFGKGLVQRPFPMPDGSMIRLTVSRYYTPSGRSIQKPYTEGEGDDYRKDMVHRYESGEFYSAENIEFPDSLKFQTLHNHRTVYGGGGIMPDLFVPVDTTAYTNYYRDLTAGAQIIKSALGYVDDHRAELTAQYPDIEAFIAGFDVPQSVIDNLIASGEADGVAFNEEQFKASEQLIRTIIKALVGRSIFENEDYYRIVYPAYNPTYRAALELIQDKKLYDTLLKKGKI